MKPAASATVLWYRRPAERWVEALPIGNGRLGAMVFGGVDRERIQLNEDSFWSGQPYDPVNPEALAALPEARRLVFAGEYKAAEDLINQRMMARPLLQASFQPIGDLLLEFAGDEPIRDYRRDLNLDTAVATTRYTQGGVTFTREVFSSPIDQVIVLQLSSDTPGRLSCRVALATPQQATISHEGATLVMRGVGPTGRNGVGGALRFECHAHVMLRGGTLTAADDSLRIEGADTVRILVDAGTSYRRYDDIGGDPAAGPHAHLAAAATKEYDALRAAHIAEHQRLFRRCSLDLGQSPASEAPTDERLINFARGTDDPQLAALYFQYGRYLLIASSRPGSQPANLQGLWNEETTPPWDSKYTININTQMNYWPAEPTNLAECVEPLIAMVKDIAVTGRRTAKVHYDAKGWVCFHNTDLWRATAPIDGAFWGYWPMGGAWLSLHLWEHYEFSGDKAFLAEAYPILKGAAQFFLDNLVEHPQRGWLVTCPTNSPENAHPHGSSICAGPSMDMSILRDLFACTAEAADILDIDRPLRTQLIEKRARLAPLQIGHAGQLQEWLDDWDTQAPEPTHRHVSHLYALHPSNQITPRGTPDLARAAAASLNSRGDISTGWAIGWRLNLWARLHDGDRAHAILKALLDPSRTYPNMFDAHPPFQIDGNFGGTAGIAQMLLQSHAGELHLLPALPQCWSSGTVTGLRAHGGFEIDVHWADGQLTAATIRSRDARRCIVRYRDTTVATSFEKNQSIRFNRSLQR